MSKISSSDRCAATYGFIDGKCRCALGAGHAGDHQYSLIEPPVPLLQYELGFAQQLEGERLRIDYYGRSHTMRVDHWLDAAWQWNGETRATHEPPCEHDFELASDALYVKVQCAKCEKVDYCTDTVSEDHVCGVCEGTQRGTCNCTTQPPSVWRSDPVIPAYEWVWVGSAYSSGYSGPFYHETPKKLSDYANADCWCLVAQPPRPTATKATSAESEQHVCDGGWGCHFHDVKRASEGATDRQRLEHYWKFCNVLTRPSFMDFQDWLKALDEDRAERCPTATKRSDADDDRG